MASLGAQPATSAKNVPGSGRSAVPSRRRGAATSASRSSSAEPVLVQHQRRREPGEDVAELVAVHLDVHGADGRAVGHDAEIAKEMLDRVVGEQRHAVVAGDAARLQERGDAAGGLMQVAVGDAAAVVGADQPCLARIAARGTGNPLSQQLRASVERHRSDHRDRGIA